MKAYYWHRFFSHQPDLNFDNPRVREEVIAAMKFWLDKGVDGLRVDAVPYLVEREGTSCENLPETHEVLKEIRRAVDAGYPYRMASLFHFAHYSLNLLCYRPKQANTLKTRSIETKT